MKNLAILASGSGTNAENIYNFFSRGNRVRVSLIIYDRASAGVAPRMQAYGVETVYVPKSVWLEHPEEIIDILRAHEIDLVVLAGFLRVIPPQITAAYPDRIINIHPSLLPAYGGMGMFGHKVHEAVIAAGETKSGVTVHYVSDEVDGGEILMQEEVEITPEDTPATLEEKIHSVEYSLFPRAIVAALRKLDDRPVEHPATGTTGATPPPIPTPAEEWAETLGVKYDESKIMPPPMPGTSDTPVNDAVEDTAATAMVSSQMVQHHNKAQDDMPAMPSTYLVWSVIMTVLCCLPAGIVAIIFSTQVSSKYYAGDIEGAKKASDRAQIWIIVAFVIGVLFNTLYLPLALLV
ncbi:MAG: phosphoribosylglycinamide formyltransferase [Muribaculaceae bacterium]|nr:phosphoribosylglycinamide formyltransferase [Muribaculaceae bacterium]